MSPSILSLAGVALTALGLSMELIRPALSRFNVQLPKTVDLALGFGGILLAAIGLFLLAYVLSAVLIVRSPIVLADSQIGSVHQTTLWWNLLSFAVLVAGVMWAAVRIPPRLVLRDSVSLFKLGFDIGTMKRDVRPDSLPELRQACDDAGLPYVAARIKRIEDAREMDRFTCEEYGRMDNTAEDVFNEVMKDIDIILMAELRRKKQT
jgi:hypothetical protein